MKTAIRNDTQNWAASVNGDAFGLENLDGYSVCASWTGSSPVGTVKLQASNNAFLNNVNNNANPDAVWVDITGSSYAVSANGTYFWNVSDVYYKAFRIVYTRTSGSATATIFINAKGIQ